MGSRRISGPARRASAPRPGRWNGGGAWSGSGRRGTAGPTTRSLRSCRSPPSSFGWNVCADSAGWSPKRPATSERGALVRQRLDHIPEAYRYVLGDFGTALERWHAGADRAADGSPSNPDHDPPPVQQLQHPVPEQHDQHREPQRAGFRRRPRPNSVRRRPSGSAPFRPDNAPGSRYTSGGPSLPLPRTPRSGSPRTPRTAGSTKVRGVPRPATCKRPGPRMPCRL